MAARRRRPPAAQDNVTTIAKAVMRAVVDLSLQNCPACKSPSLSFAVSMRSGVKITCDGYDTKTASGECEFVRVILAADLEPVTPPALRPLSVIGPQNIA